MYREQSIAIIQTAYILINDEIPIAESYCTSLFEIALETFQKAQSIEILEYIMKFLVECCKYPDFSSDYGYKIIPQFLIKVKHLFLV